MIKSEQELKETAWALQIVSEYMGEHAKQLPEDFNRAIALICGRFALDRLKDFSELYDELETVMSCLTTDPRFFQPQAAPAPQDGSASQPGH